MGSPVLMESQSVVHHLFPSLCALRRPSLRGERLPGPDLRGLIREAQEGEKDAKAEAAARAENGGVGADCLVSGSWFDAP